VGIMKKVGMLLAALAFGMAALASASEIVVLKGGTRLELAKPYVVKGAQAIMTLTNGTVVSVAAREIDRAATRTARAETAPPPAAASEPAESVSALAEAARAQKSAPKAAVRVGDEDVAHEYPGLPQEGEGGEEGAGGADVTITNWDQSRSVENGAVTVSGTLQNVGKAVAENVTLTVSGQDADGKTVGTAAASVAATKLDPGATSTFTARIPSAVRLSSVRFQPSWRSPAPPLPGTVAPGESKPAGDNGPGKEAAAGGKAPAAAAPAASQPAAAKTPQYRPQPDYAAPTASAPTAPPADNRFGFLPDHDPSTIPPPPAPKTQSQPE
jgi:hypothetical protein